LKRLARRVVPKQTRLVGDGVLLGEPVEFSDRWAGSKTVKGANSNSCLTECPIKNFCQNSRNSVEPEILRFVAFVAGASLMVIYNAA